MRKYLFLLLICCAYLLADCRKQSSVAPPTASTNHQPIAVALTSHFSYKNGSYWVYRDSITGRRDSFYTLWNFTGFEYVHYSQDYGYYFCDIQINSVNIDSPSIADTVVWKYHMERSTFNALVLGKASYNPFLVYPFELGSGGCIEMHTAFTINGRAFQNVAEINHWPDKFYINDSIGIVKMRLGQSDTVPPTHVWELQRWKVIK